MEPGLFLMALITLSATSISAAEEHSTEMSTLSTRPNNVRDEISADEYEMRVLERISNWSRSHGSLSRYARPRNMDDGRTLVYFTVTLKELLEFDVKKQILEGYFLIGMRWNDPRLVWDPEEYGYIDVTFVPISSIWVPVIMCYNSSAEEEKLTDIKAVVYPNGGVFWMPAVKYRLRCRMTVKYFPWDSHYCHLAFGSWTLSDSELKLEKLELPYSPSVFKTTCGT